MYLRIIEHVLHVLKKEGRLHPAVNLFHRLPELHLHRIGALLRGVKAREREVHRGARHRRGRGQQGV